MPLAEQIKKAFETRARCKIEIRATKSGEGNSAANRLLHALRAGGLEATIITGDTAAPPSALLIESAHEFAGQALALQSAFKGAGLEAQLLVHRKSDPDCIVLHLGDTK